MVEKDIIKRKLNDKIVVARKRFKQLEVTGGEGSEYDEINRAIELMKSLMKDVKELRNRLIGMMDIQCSPHAMLAEIDSMRDKDFHHSAGEGPIHNVHCWYNYMMFGMHCVIMFYTDCPGEYQYHF